MAGILHIAEVAAILAVAYAIGWVVGYFARRFWVSRPDAMLADSIAVAVASGPAAGPDPLEFKSAAAPAAAPAPAAPSESPASVAEPGAVAPAAVPSPAVTEVEPVPAPSTTPAPAPTPPPVAIATTLPPMDIPSFVPPAALRIEPLPPRAKPVPPPPTTTPEPEPDTPLTAMPAARPGVAWSGEIRGRAAPATEPPAPAKIFAEPPIEVPVSLEFTETVAFVAEAEPVGTEQVEPESILAVGAEDAVLVPPAEAPPPVLPPAAAPVHDEDAAMRAIEGGWSRVKARALPGSPEISDVGAAVAAAQSAVEQVLAKAGIDPESSQRAAKPVGLPIPRGRIKDDLKRIAGVAALDESTLNNLGIYHFDQIAGWDEAEVLWMENHVFALGRIGRENWQPQARKLAAETPR